MSPQLCQLPWTEPPRTMPAPSSDRRAHTHRRAKRSPLRVRPRLSQRQWSAVAGRLLATQSLKVASLHARQTRCSTKVSVLSHVQSDRKVATDSVTLRTVAGSLNIVQRDSLCQEELPEGRITQLKTRGHGRIVQMRKWRKKSSRYREHRGRALWQGEAQHVWFRGSPGKDTSFPYPLLTS